MSRPARLGIVSHRAAAALTARQRAFVEALAKDPEGNATQAARAAGAGKAASVRASRWLTLAKVQAYLAELTAEAAAKADAERLGAVASLQEVLKRLTAIVRAGDMGRYIRLAADGGIEPNYEAIRRAPPGALTFRQGKKGSWGISLHADRALDTLFRHYTGRLGNHS